jgi:hypothetical protein
MNVWISAITGVVVAVAAVVSTWILWKTFESVNAQTGISRNQFEMMLRNREEMSRPELTVSVGKYIPSLNSEGKDTGTKGILTVTVCNFGAIAVRELTVSVLDGNAATPLLYNQGTLSIPPGSSEDVRGAYYMPPADWTSAETKCEFETPDGKRFIQWDKWKLYYSPDREHDHLDSHLEEIPPTSAS